jgi:hypothetical protein
MKGIREEKRSETSKKGIKEIRNGERNNDRRGKLNKRRGKVEERTEGGESMKGIEGNE